MIASNEEQAEVSSRQALIERSVVWNRACLVRGWQPYVLLGAAVGLIGLIYLAYSQVYTRIDLWFPWLGARLWLSGIDPYSAEATIALTGSRSPTVSGFPYPFPVVLLALPLATLPLDWAATIWAVLSLLAVLALPMVTLGRWSPWMGLLTLLFFPFWSAMELAQWGPILLAFALLSLYCYRTSRQWWSGLILPLVLLKPQVGIALFLAVSAFVLLGGATRRWWWGITLGFILWWGTSLLIDPSWPLRWIGQLQRYAAEGQNSIVALSPAGMALTVISGGVAAIAWRQRDAEVVLGAVLLSGMLVLPMRSYYNQTLLLLPLLLLAARRPRSVMIAALLSWSVFGLALAGIDILTRLVLGLYAPLAWVLLAALRSPAPTQSASRAPQTDPWDRAPRGGNKIGCQAGPTGYPPLFRTDYQSSTIAYEPRATPARSSLLEEGAMGVVASSEQAHSASDRLQPAIHAVSAPYLSVVVPIYNEEESLPTLYTRLTDDLQALGYSYEIIAVDDGSRDRSFAILRELALRDPRLRVVRFRRNFGQTAAFSAGFERARGQVIVTIDADLQNDPADIGALLAKMEEGYDVVSGWRERRQDPFLNRRLPSLLANGLISRVTGVALHDYGCSLKAYRAEVLRNIRLYGELHRFIPAIASWQGVAVAEIPVRHAPRQFGKSKYGIGRTTRVLLDLLTVRFLLSYGTRPMQIFGLLGLLSMLLGIVTAGYLTAIKFIEGAAIANRPLLLLAVLLIVLGVQFISLGLIGELIVRTYYETQSKPIYAVREELNGGRPSAS